MQVKTNNGFVRPGPRQALARAKPRKGRKSFVALMEIQEVAQARWVLGWSKNSAGVPLLHDLAVPP